MRLLEVTSIAAVFGMSVVLVNGRPDVSNFRVPRGLKQASRSEVAARLARGSDKTHAAKRQTASNLPSGPCGNPVNGGGFFGCMFQPYCSTLLQGSEQIGAATTQPSFSACLAACDSNPVCGSISYHFTPQQCVLYNVNSAETVISDTDYESAIYTGC